MQIRRANPRAVIYAGLFNPSGQAVSAGQLVTDVRLTSHLVHGYWLNIPGAGPDCPRCGTAQPLVAVALLRALGRSA